MPAGPAETPAEVRSAAAPANPAGLPQLTEPWIDLAPRLPIKGIAAQLALQSEWVGVDGNTVVLRVANKGLAEGPGVDRLRGALEAHFGAPVRLRFEIGTTGDNTAHAVAQVERQARQQAAEEAIMGDPFVRQLLDDFGGQIVPDSIRPENPEPTQGTSP
ncbi:DNA polymerase III subunit gamma/tau C-terminal domain-containing protein [Pigmentiphaga soli]